MFKSKIIVVKIGGSTFGQHDTTLDDLVTLQKRKVPVVVIHGGGNAVRLIALLPCLVGAWRHRAGGLLLSSAGWFRGARRDAWLKRPDLLAGRTPRTINMVTIGDDLKTAQYGWPLGMPLIRKLEAGLWEVRSKMQDRIARVIFTVEDDTMVLLHGFIKKSQKMPLQDLRLARQRLHSLGEE
mgnify:CR=1 FL=1